MQAHFVSAYLRIALNLDIVKFLNKTMLNIKLESLSRLHTFNGTAIFSFSSIVDGITEIFFTPVS